MIRLLAATALILALAGPALADPPPLAGWDKVRFGITSKALLDTFPGVTWTEEAGIDAGSEKRSFRTEIDGAPHDVTVILTADRVSRVTVSKVIAPGLDEAACKAAFVPEEARLRAVYGPPGETSVGGERWTMGAGSRLVIVNVRLLPDDGSPAQCLVTTGYYAPGSPPPAPMN